MKRIEKKEKRLNKIIALFKDWKFVYKFISFLSTTLILLLAFVYGCFIEFWYITPSETDQISTSRIYNAFVIFSFWSVHTNILVSFWFLYALFYNNREEKNKFTNSKTQLNLTVYITLTFLIFWGYINFPFDNVTKFNYVLTFLTHFLTPLFMIIYYPLSNCKKHISYKTFFIKDFFIMMIYPVSYCLYSYVRGEMLIKDGVDSYVYCYEGILDFSQIVVKNTPLWLSNIICMIILTFILFAFQFLYVVLNNFVFKYMSKKNKVKQQAN